jgi:hypothetical protein
MGVGIKFLALGHAAIGAASVTARYKISISLLYALKQPKCGKFGKFLKNE